MAQLWDLGIRGTALDVVAAWKEVLLAALLLVVAWKVRRLRHRGCRRAGARLRGRHRRVRADAAGLVGREATTRGELLALRHHLLPVGAYALGPPDLGVSGDRIASGVVAALTAAGVAVDRAARPRVRLAAGLARLRRAGWYREQLGLEYEGLSGLPENWVYNTGDEENPIRRLVSTFLSRSRARTRSSSRSCSSSSRPLRWWWALLAALLYVGAPVHAHAGRARRARGRARRAGVRPATTGSAVLAAARLVVAAAFLVAYPTIGPSTSYTPEELEFLRANAEGEPATADPFSPSESSTREPLAEPARRDPRRAEHPQGHGLGNAGVVAKRTGVEIKAGESTYAELGVDTGIAGLAAFVLWSGALLLGLLRREAWIGAAFAAVLLLGLQTDVIGMHWLAVAVWALAGLALGRRRAENGRDVICAAIVRGFQY